MKPYPFRVGVHTSIAGGLPKAIESAVAKRCDGLQIFARNPRGWMARELEPGEVRAFREARERAGLWPLAIHAVYLVNLAAQDPIILERSRRAFREEIERAIQLGADYLVVHPGNPVSAPADVGIITAVESIRVAARGLNLQGAPAAAKRPGRSNGLTILIENTAGQGSAIGCRFEQIADMLAMLDDLPVGVCLDTAHTLAAGYDLASAKGLKALMREIERSFGFEPVKLIHCNDSKTPMGSRVDRHQHIGEGYIGAEAFRRLTHTLKFRRIPFILETPVDSCHDDTWNINRLRELASDEELNGRKKAQELDVVELIEDLPEFGLKKGEIGAVVVAFDSPDEACDLEFVDESGQSKFAYAIKPSQIRKVDETARDH